MIETTYYKTDISSYIFYNSLFLTLLRTPDKAQEDKSKGMLYQAIGEYYLKVYDFVCAAFVYLCEAAIIAWWANKKLNGQ